MSKYTFKFKYKNENRKLYLPIAATLEHKAIEEIKDFIEYEKEKGKEVELGYLQRHIERTETVWIMGEDEWED